MTKHYEGLKTNDTRRNICGLHNQPIHNPVLALVFFCLFGSFFNFNIWSFIAWTYTNTSFISRKWQSCGWSGWMNTPINIFNHSPESSVTRAWKPQIPIRIKNRELEEEDMIPSKIVEILLGYNEINVVKAVGQCYQRTFIYKNQKPLANETTQHLNHWILMHLMVKG